jgi:predicted kinase
MPESSSASVEPISPTLILLVGPPGTGKSTVAQRLREVSGADIVQTDAIRKALVSRPTYLPAESAWVHRVAQQRLRQKLSHGQSVIFDATNLRKAHRRSLQKLAESLGARSLVLVAWASESVIRTRLQHRHDVPDASDKSDADWAVYQHLIGSFEPVDSPHIVVNTTVDLYPAIRRVYTLLQG